MNYYDVSMFFNELFGVHIEGWNVCFSSGHNSWGSGALLASNGVFGECVSCRCIGNCASCQNYTDYCSNCAICSNRLALKGWCVGDCADSWIDLSCSHLLLKDGGGWSFTRTWWLVGGSRSAWGSVWCPERNINLPPSEIYQPALAIGTHEMTFSAGFGAANVGTYPRKYTSGNLKSNTVVLNVI